MATRLEAIKPTLENEIKLWDMGILRVAGIDEVGRGALAGPVYAAAVILPARKSILEELIGVCDSKLMTAEEREEWAPIIKKKAIAWSLGWASCKEIDRWNILSCTYLAARRAVQALKISPDHLLLDNLQLVKVNLPQTAVADGDTCCLSIAAASVIAKVTRDAELCKLDNRFPTYGFASHKGYATEEHLLAIRKHGPCPQHRLSFAPMRPQ